MNDRTLAAVEQAFQQWRAQRSSRAEQIPEALWSMALELYPQYKYSKICHFLHLNGGQFKRRLADANKTPKRFVVACHDKVKATPIAKNTIQLTLQGQSRSLILCFDTAVLGQVLPHIGMLL